MDSQQNQPQPSNQMSKTTAWVVLAVIILAVGIGVYFLLKEGNANAPVNTGANSNLNANAISNTNAVVNANTTVNTNTNNITITNANLTEWKVFKNMSPKYQFDFPPYLIQQENYPNRLVQSVEKTGVIEFIKIGVITEEEIKANQSAKDYMDGISVEFSGTFKELSKANQVKHGANQLIEKSYIYHATLEETGDYTKKETLLMMQISRTGDYLLIQVFGENTTTFDQAVDQITKSITF